MLTANAQQSLRRRLSRDRQNWSISETETATVGRAPETDATGFLSNVTIVSAPSAPDEWESGGGTVIASETTELFERFVYVMRPFEDGSAMVADVLLVRLDDGVVLVTASAGVDTSPIDGLIDGLIDVLQEERS